MTTDTEQPPEPEQSTAGAAAAADGADLIGPVTVGPVAHGGHCVARYEGRVIFVRHALPGERVLVRVTDATHRNFWRADAVTIIDPSPDRVEPDCPIAGPGRCGGCDFQHVDLAAQRRLKAEVLSEQLKRLAGIEPNVWVEPVDGDSDDGPDAGRRGERWRTRMRYLFDQHGRPGLRVHRSHAVIPLPEEGCRIAVDSINRPPSGVGTEETVGVAAGDGVHWVGEQDPSTTVTEYAAGRTWQLDARAFWQVHRAAAELLTGVVLQGLQPARGETALDLYCGVGLFSGALADAGCRVIGVENSRQAVAGARNNLADVGQRARFVQSRVDRALSRPRGRGALPPRVDLVVLDPPRSGAGGTVISQISRRAPRAIGYVACDPAALARDLGILFEHGYRIDSLRAFDLFPMTHHMECVAILSPGPAGGP